MTRMRPFLLAVAATALLAAAAHAKVTTVATGGEAAGELGGPAGIAIDADGNVVVSEAANARGQKFSPAGTALLTFGGPGAADHQLGDGSSPDMGIAVGANGDYYVASGGTGAVHRYRPDGTFVSRFTHDSLTAVSDVAALANGDIYVLGGGRIVRFDATGAYVGSWALTYPSGASAPGFDLAGAGDRLYVLLGASPDEPKSIVAYDGSGTEIVRWTYAGTTGPFERGSVAAASGIGTDADGNVLMVGGGSAAATVVKFDGEGRHLGTWPPAPRDQVGPPNEPCGFYRAGNWDGYPPSATDVAGDADGNIWLIDGSDQLHRLDSAPRVTLDWAGADPPIDSIAAGTRLTLDASGSYAPFEQLARFEWDFDGDGTFELDTGTTPTASFRYASPGVFKAAARVTAASGASAVATHSFRIVPWSPDLTAGFSLAGRPAVLHSQASLLCSRERRFEWDLDGDGTFEQDTGATPSVTTSYPEPGRYRVAVRVTREGGHVGVTYGEHGVYLPPPPGLVSVTINDGARFTNSRKVKLGIVWPPYTGAMVVGNGPDLRGAARLPPTQKVTWRLRTDLPERIPRVVSVRFIENAYRGAFPIFDDMTRSDEIVLDRTRPVVAAVRLTRAARHVRKLRLKARDRVSGVKRMQVTTKKRKPGPWRKYRRRTAVRTRAKRIFVRVRDRAGNVSRWQPARLSR